MEWEIGDDAVETVRCASLEVEWTLDASSEVEHHLGKVTEVELQPS